MDPSDGPSRLVIAIARLDLLWLALLVGGAYSAALGWRPGAILMLTALLGLLVGHLVTGFSEYRRLMNRPWPQVSPLEEDDDD
jgi:uncharacterized protein (DUF58 family)